MKKLAAFLLSICFFLSLLSAQTASYDDIEFPQWSKDLRRTEIITFGSLPFVTMWTTMAYSGYKYGRLSNPFDKSTSNFTTQDQKNIMATSAMICIGLGLIDLTVSLIRRHYNKRNTVSAYQEYVVMPLSKEFEIKNDDLQTDEIVLPLEKDELPEYFLPEMENTLQ